MNLIIDVGNTYVKLAVFENDNIIRNYNVKDENLLNTIKLIKDERYEIDKVIISSVGNLDESILNYIKKYFVTLILNEQTKLPFKNLYATPTTLGKDRIALVSAAGEQYSKSNVLIIDAGTCITYDFINSQNEYLGGSISPGIRTRYKSLNNLTANLPLLDTEIPNNFIGNSTKSSIHSGVIHGIIHEIEGVVKEYQKKYSDLTIILTGGDANFLSKQLKSSIFANSNFLLMGLNYILQFNSK